MSLKPGDAKFYIGITRIRLFLKYFSGLILSAFQQIKVRCLSPDTEFIISVSQLFLGKVTAWFFLGKVDQKVDFLQLHTTRNATISQSVSILANT